MPRLYKKRGQAAWLVPCKNSPHPNLWLACKPPKSALYWTVPELSSVAQERWWEGLFLHGTSQAAFPRFLTIPLTLALLCLYACTPPSITQHPKPYTTTDSIPNPISYLLFGSGKKAADKSDSLSLSELKLLQKGDILLRKGYGSISDYIADFLQEQYPVTHCGFVVQNGDSLAILHTISTDAHNGMLVEPLSSYLRQSQGGTVIAIRLKTDTAKIEKALHLAALLVAQKIPFDMGFDDKNAASLYCLEMVRNVLKEVFQKDILPKRQTKHGVDVLSMDNFFDTTYFEVVFNHFDLCKSGGQGRSPSPDVQHHKVLPKK